MAEVKTYEEALEFVIEMIDDMDLPEKEKDSLKDKMKKHGKKELIAMVNHKLSENTEFFI